MNLSGENSLRILPTLLSRRTLRTLRDLRAVPGYTRLTIPVGKDEMTSM